MLLHARSIPGILEKIHLFIGPKSTDLAVTIAAETGDAYAVLVSTMLSLRTRDEVTRVATPKLLARAPTPAKMLELSEQEIAQIIYPTSFHNMKAKALLKCSRQIIDEHNGQVPRTFEGLTSLYGVGRKSANLILTLAFHEMTICVDTHVHRLSNRIGFVQTDTPHQTELALKKVLPPKWWIDINGLLIAFGKNHCTPVSPKCSSCVVNDRCPKIGVARCR